MLVSVSRQFGVEKKHSCGKQLGTTSLQTLLQIILSRGRCNYFNVCGVGRVFVLSFVHPWHGVTSSFNQRNKG